ncbi:MAG: Bro-N domain-containing protein [candidate division Zixibacteria bacterium]|nr:Bro-N domain-containing protein [candidate division Zixibacteria bacterium]
MTVSPDNELIPEGSEQTTLFQKREIRKVFHGNEWYFSIIDVIEALADTPEPASYWGKMKKNDPQLSREWTKLKLAGKDGRDRDSECANTEELFRVIQSITSPNAEPFKRWLARVGYERIEEFQNPEIAIKRAILTYKIKGYSDEWIDVRVRTILSRKELTGEWQKRGVKDKEYAILTDVISEATFGIKTKKHKELKGLAEKGHALRDHMTDLELVLTMLGEKSTTMIANKIDAYGFNENKKAAKAGGSVAGEARNNLEKQLGETIVSTKNYLNPPPPNGSSQIAASLVKAIEDKTVKTSKNGKKPKE